MSKISQVFPTPQAIPGDPETGVPRIVDLEILLQNIFSVVIVIAGVALLAMLIYGGFTWLTAGGNAQKVEGARGVITNAILGLVLIAISFLIIQLIANFVFSTPSTLLQFNLYR